MARRIIVGRFALSSLLKLATQRPPNVTLTRLRYRLGVVALKVDNVAFFGNFSTSESNGILRNCPNDPSINRGKFNVTYRNRDEIQSRSKTSLTMDHWLVMDNAVPHATLASRTPMSRRNHEESSLEHRESSNRRQREFSFLCRRFLRKGNLSQTPFARAPTCSLFAVRTGKRVPSTPPQRIIADEARLAVAARDLVARFAARRKPQSARPWKRGN